MPDIAAIASAASALKSAYDLSKAAIGLHDAAAIRAKVTEMQGEISSALASAIAAQTDQLAALKRVSDLEKKLTDLKAWEDDKKRYEMKRWQSGAIVYSLRVDNGGSEPPHDICAACYQRGRKYILQRVPGNAARSQLGIPTMYRCPDCRAEVIG